MTDPTPAADGDPVPPGGESRPKPWREIRADELKAVKDRRAAFAQAFQAPSPSCFVRSIDRALQQRDAAIRQYFRAGDAPPATDVLPGLAGLALSGGGVRSATFNLGVLQRLQELGILQKLDYLSTVSGGGYTGCALAAYLAQPGAAFPFTGRVDNDENIVLRHFRRFSSFLVARGWLDVLVAALIAFGGILANVLILGPLLLVLALAAVAQLDVIDASLSLRVSGVLVVLALLAALAFARASATLGRAGTSWSDREIVGRRWASTVALALLAAVWMVQPLIVEWLATLTRTSVAAAVAGMSGVAGFLARGRFSVAMPTLRRPVLLGLLVAGMVLLLWSIFALLGAGMIHLKEAIGMRAVAWSAIALALALLLIGRRLPANCGTLHGFYRDRLSKAYLLKPGAPGAAPLQSFDDCQMSALPVNAAPYLLVNACLNVSDTPSRSEDLAGEYVRPGRKGTFFLFSRHAVGSESLGYVPAAEFEHYNGLSGSLGSAMAISGAAFGPNMGYNTTAATAFLLTLLNARTGSWMRFPSDGARVTSTQRLLGDYAYLTLFREAVSRFDNSAGTLLLSDGGHVDNLGLYQLLKRRCSLVIASDAEADPRYAFQGLASAVRLAKIDLNITVEIDYSQLAGIGEAKHRHFAVGRIHYPEGTEGTLIYLKSSLSDEALRDVSLLYYHRSNATFPHESTADQFFTEQQFEAYRSLGYFACMKTFDGPRDH